MISSSEWRPGSAAGPARRQARSRRDVVFRRVDPLEPDLAPVRVDAAGAEPVVVTGADDAVEDDAVRLDLDHLAVLLLDDPVHPAEDASGAAAVAGHLVVEVQAAV